MNKSESIKSLAAALAKAQAELKPAAKDSVNPHFKNSYADLTACIEASSAILSRNGLSFTQLAESDPAGAVAIVTTMLMHESGEWIASTINLKPSKPDAQGMGSAITYAKRYGLCAIIGLGTADDDGNEAAKPEKPAQPQRPVAPKAPANPERAELRRVLAQWADVKPEDMGAVVAELVRRNYGIKVPAKDLGEEDCRKLSAFCKAQMAAGVEYMAWAKEGGK